MMTTKDKTLLALALAGLIAAAGVLAWNAEGGADLDALNGVPSAAIEVDATGRTESGEPITARRDDPIATPVEPAATAIEPAAPEPIGESAALWGRVVERAGDGLEPVAGAVVALCRDVSDHSGLTLQGEVVNYVTTDERGYFQLDDLETLSRYLLRVELEGFASRFVPKLDLLAREARKLEIVLSRGFAITGSVVDGAGSPLAGVRIEVVDQTIRVADASGGVERNGRTDADGRFRIETLTNGFKAVYAIKDGMATQGAGNVLVGPSETPELNFTMGPGTFLAGQVLFEDNGEPVPGVLISALPIESTGAIPKSYPTISSGGDGRFRYDGLEPGSYRLMFARPSMTGFVARTTARTGTTDLRVSLKRPATLSGRVIDADTGTPITEFSIVSCPRDNAIYTSQRARLFVRDAEGRFAYSPEQQSGVVWLFVEAPGYAGGRSAALTIDPGASTENIEIRVDRGQEVRGVVFDVDRKPVPGANVKLLPEAESVAGGGSNDAGAILVRQLSAGLRTANRAATTDRDGRFSIGAVAIGRYRALVTCAGFADSRGETAFEVVIGAGADVPPITLHRGARLTGVVRDSKGDVAADVTVKLSDKQSLLSPGNYITRTDASGRYEITAITPGIYWVDALRSGAAGGVTQIFDLAVAPRDRASMALGDGDRAELDLTIK